MKNVVIALIVIVVLALVGVGIYASYRNQMVTKNETVKADWAQVDNVLQRRADLIPNLVATVKGIAAQEQTVFHDVDVARAALLSAQTPQDKIAANGQLDGALVKFLSVVENYPQLKSNESFLKLQDELAGTENRITIERQRYNLAIQDYNTYITRFPANIIAGMAGFQRNDAYFKASEGSREVPKVEFPAPNR